jgi:phage internal scaffolding protein
MTDLQATKNDDLIYDIQAAKSVVIHVRHAYNYDTDKVSLETGFVSDPETLTQQHQAKETDINYIVQQFGVTGLLPQVGQLPTYGDFSAVIDYQSALNLIIEADKAFMALPADARAHFGNDAGQFLHYIENNPDPKVLQSLGLARLVENQQHTPDLGESTVPLT